MTVSKFTEIMDPTNSTHTASDVRLEDILAVTDKRGRTPSETSASSQESRQNSGERVSFAVMEGQGKAKGTGAKGGNGKRLSRLLSISKK